MLREHKNQLLEIIQSLDLDASKFEAQEENQKFTVGLKNTPLKFLIQQNPTDFDQFMFKYTRYEPIILSKHYKFDEEDIDFFLPTYVAFPTIEREFKYWLNAVVKRYFYEKEIPDFWSQLQTYATYAQLSAIPENDLLPFSEEEKARIRHSIVQLESHFTDKFDLLEDQQKFISERLDYLSKAVERLNRFDWKAQAFSTFTGIAINLGIDTSTGRELFKVIKQMFGFISSFLLPGK